MRSDILWRTTRPFMHNDMFGIGCSSFQESIANKSRRQALEELTVRLGKPAMVVSLQMLMMDLLRSLTDHTTHILMPIAYHHQNLAIS